MAVSAKNVSSEKGEAREEVRLSDKEVKQIINKEMERESLAPDRDLADGDDPPRERFSGTLAFLLSAVGFAVGLGNIWRFPSLVYGNGGGAFLIPYFFFTFLVGIPMIYLDSITSQYCQAGSATLYYKYSPFMQGVGWMQVLMVFVLTTYYYVVIGWAVVFIVDTVRGNSHTWAKCGNEWNTMLCRSHLSDQICKSANDTTPYYVNGACSALSHQEVFPNSTFVVPTEEFFEKWVLNRSDDFSGIAINWKMLAIMFVLWSLAALIVWRGVRFMGQISYITTTVPYVIIVIFFIRGLTLEGSGVGIDYFLLKPDFSKLALIKTWSAALSQVCVSLAVGFGGMQTLGSYNPRDHNCLRDAITIVVADTFMSLIGGTAVFSILGYLSKTTGRPMAEVAQGGPSLVFVVYPEAMGTMPAQWLWALLFFTMLFTLGLSSVVVNVQCVVTYLSDLSTYCKKKKEILGPIVCLVFFLAGIIMCTRAGMYYVDTLDAIASGFAIFVALFLEVITFVHIYGPFRLRTDILSVFGEPSNKFLAIFGHGGYYYIFNWLLLSPIAAALVFYFTAAEGLNLSYGKGDRRFIFPPWTNVFVWTFTSLSLAIVPAVMVYNIIRVKKESGSYWDAFRIHSSHPSYKRIHGETEEILPGDVSSVSKLSSTKNSVKAVPSDLPTPESGTSPGAPLEPSSVKAASTTSTDPAKTGVPRATAGIAAQNPYGLPLGLPRPESSPYA